MNILNELKAAHAALPKIDKKDWFIQGAGDVTQIIDDNDDLVCEILWDDLPDGPANNRAHLIALTKNHLPALIECVEVLQDVIDSGALDELDALEGWAKRSLSKLGNKNDR